MPADTPAITLRPVTADDLAMIEEWIGRPHWQEWWGDPTEETAGIRAMVEGRDTTRPFIFEVDGKSAGYTQYWFADEQKSDEKLGDHRWLASLPRGSVGIDISIAEASALSKGLGSAIVGAMARRLWHEGHRHITIDPHTGNSRAIRAYEKAGFRVIEELHGKTGDVLLMRFDPASLKDD